MAKKTTLKEFESVFPKLEEDLLAWVKQYNLPEQQQKWYKQVRLPLHSMIYCSLLISNILYPVYNPLYNLNSLVVTVTCLQ